jgi:ketosteroid isomerase-like protein
VGQCNVDIVRRVFAAIEARDPDGVVALADPNMALFAPETGAEAGQPHHLYHGHDGIRQYFEHVAKVWEELDTEPREFWEREDYVIAFGTRKGTLRKGRRIEQEVGWAWRFRDELIVWSRVYGDPEQARREFPMPKIEFMTRVMQAIGARDLEAALPFISPELEFDAPVTAAVSGGEHKTYRGHDGLRECFEDLSQVWEEVHPEVEHYREAGDHVLAFGSIKGLMKDGREVDSEVSWAWRVEDDLVNWMREYTDAATALRAVGLSAG